MTRTLRGYAWQVHKQGDPVWQTSNGRGWAEAGTQPEEWQAIKENPEIDQAKLYTNAQSHRCASKRRPLDSKGGDA